jgi:osmoprotectant transport system permease protein
MNYLLNPLHYDLSDQSSIPNLLLQHLSIVGISMLISLIIALPLGLLVARYRRLYLPVLTATGLLYTIPGLALLAFLVPVTGLSPATIIIPLVVYTQLVLIRNTAAAVNGINPLLPEVGRAMGMNGQQMLLRVTLPLALPVIIAGVRVATVTTIGIATLASLVGQGGLGDLIFTGIQNQNYDQVVAGAIVIALLAIFFDLALLGIQIALNRGRSAISLA